jgi:RNA polymerase sigma-70 factor (ECF subfamily)
VQQSDRSDGDPPDQDIVELLRGGAMETAFERLVSRYENKVYRLCCSVLRDPDQAQDAAQESLLRVWKALPKYDRRASLSTWIYTITRNRCLTAIERRRIQESLSDPAVELEVEGLQASAPERDEDQAAILRGLVDELPERYRNALTLYYYEDRAVGEVAQMLGVPEGTIKTNLHRARALLLERIRTLGLADPALWLEKLA